MRAALAALLLSALPLCALAQPVPELSLVAEHAVQGMPRGNLSGLASCNGELWAVSDRDDQVIYRMDTSAPLWQAQPYSFVAPLVPVTDLPWGLRSRTWAASLLRGGDLDFEGISCDAKGNRYLVSEAHAAVLQLPVEGAPAWLQVSPALVRQARASGMLLHFNALFEGLAVNPAGDRLYLAAERERRGLLVVTKRQSVWDCDGGCVLMSEAGEEIQPAQITQPKKLSRDFSDLAYFDNKLFTLERNAYQICRRSPQTGAVERCWSFADAALTPERRYDQPYGLTEALVIDAQGAWVGTDNNETRRADGELRPTVWRFAAPAGGWGAKP
jgi:hypothetical protein